jgi:hypothetical protein
MKPVVIMVASLIWVCLVSLSVMSNLTLFAKDPLPEDQAPIMIPTSTTQGACLEKMKEPEWRPFGGPFPGYVYTTKTKNKDGTMTCPEGYFTTGCTNNDGDVAHLQCRKIAVPQPGIWSSPKYGGEGGGDLKTYRCGPGEIVSHVVGFYGQNNDSNTNAFTAFCKKPGEEKITPIMSNATCGKRNAPDASQGFADFFSSLMALLNFDFINLYQKSFGRKLYKNEFATSERGFDSWSVKVKDNEVHGLRLRSKDQTELVAGGQDPNSTYKEYTGRCPAGKSLIGFRARCGDRVDQIQMLCDVDTHTNARIRS